MGKRLFWILALITLGVVSLKSPIVDNFFGNIINFARNFAEHGNGFFNPYRSGAMTLSESPVFYLLSALFVKFLGYADYFAKAPLFIVLLLQVFYVYRTARALNDNERAGVIAGVVSLTSVPIMLKYNLSYAGLFTALALSMVLYYTIEEKIFRAMVSIAIGAVAGGFSIIPFAIIPMFSYCYVHREFIFKKKNLSLGVLAFFLILFSWFFILSYKTNIGVWEIFKEWLFSSFNNKFYHPVYYAMTYVFMHLPWIMFLPLYVSVYKIYAKDFEKRTKMNWLFMSFISYFVLTYLFRLKIPEAFAAMAVFYSVFSGVTLDRFLKYDGKNIFGIISFLIGFALIVYFVIFINSNTDRYTMLLGFSSLPNIYLLIPLLIFLLFGWIFIVYQRRELSIWGLCFFSIGTILMLANFYNIEINGNSSFELAREIKKSGYTIDDEVYVEGPSKPSLAFYLRKDTESFEDLQSLEKKLKENSEKAYVVANKISFDLNGNFKKIANINGNKVYITNATVLAKPKEEPVVKEILKDNSKEN